MTRCDIPHHPSYNVASGTTEARPEDGWHNAPTWLNVKVILPTQVLSGLDVSRQEIASWMGVIPEYVEISVIVPSD
jgi:hypothetical protein